MAGYPAQADCHNKIEGDLVCGVYIYQFWMLVKSSSELLCSLLLTPEFAVDCNFQLSSRDSAYGASHFQHRPIPCFAQTLSLAHVPEPTERSYQASVIGVLAAAVQIHRFGVAVINQCRVHQCLHQKIWGCRLQLALISCAKTLLEHDQGSPRSDDPDKS